MFSEGQARSADLISQCSGHVKLRDCAGHSCLKVSSASHLYSPLEFAHNVRTLFPDAWEMACQCCNKPPGVWRQYASAKLDVQAGSHPNEDTTLKLLCFSRRTLHIHNALDGWYDQLWGLSFHTTPYIQQAEISLSLSTVVKRPNLPATSCSVACVHHHQLRGLN